MPPRRILTTLSALLLTLALSAQSLPFMQSGGRVREYRAVWVTTLSGLDWPSCPARTEREAERQKAELVDILDRLRAAGINTILFQTRLRGTVAYPSAIEPWDGVFSGRTGVAPPYDPLQFAVEACHDRGMEIHAWVVAFPAGSVQQVKQQGKYALPKRRPDLCRQAGDAWYIDPANPDVADYIAKVCTEIVDNYDVDGIHLDYIRYPEPTTPWNDAAAYRKSGSDLSLSDWRRANVTNVVRRIHDAVKARRPWVRLSCSPVGKRADLPRQSSYGWNAQNAVYQDAAHWLQEGLMDVLFPMMYFDGKHFYPFLADWKEQSGGRPVAPGLGIYFLSPREKDWPLSVITRQLFYARTLSTGGAAFFRSRFLTDNVKGLYSFLRDQFYTQQVLTPAISAPDTIRPLRPTVTATRSGNKLHLSWTASAPSQTSTPITYNIYRLPSATSPDTVLIASRLATTSYTLYPALPALLHARYAVTAMDAYGRESEM